MDCILMGAHSPRSSASAAIDNLRISGVIFCQVYTYFLLRRVDHGLSQYYTYLVVFVTFLSVTKVALVLF
jgi:hypothetical protein